MTFARLQSDPWKLGQSPTDTDFESLDQHQSDSLDGTGGGTYAPGAQIVIGGKGLAVTGPFEVTVASTFTEDVSVGASVSVGTVANLGRSSVIHGDLAVSGASEFVSARVSGRATLSGGLAVDTDTGKNFYIAGGARWTVSAPSQWTETMTLGDEGWVSERIVDGPTHSSTFSVLDADIVRVPVDVDSGTTYTIVNDGAVAGARIRVTRLYVSESNPFEEAALTHACLVSINGGTGLHSLGDASGSNRFLEIVYNGTAWFVSRLEKNS